LDKEKGGPQRTLEAVERYILMKVEFDFTLSDLADISERVLPQVPRTGSWQVDILAFLLGGNFGFFFADKAGFNELGGFAGGALLLSVACWLSRRGARRRRVMQMLRAIYGNDGPYSCVVELKESGIVCTQMAATTVREWSSVRDVSLSEDSVDIIFIDNLIAVRDRAFPTSDEKRRFFEMARQYWENSKTPHSEGTRA
jgi:hypothetical protein